MPAAFGTLSQTKPPPLRSPRKILNVASGIDAVRCQLIHPVFGLWTLVFACALRAGAAVSWAKTQELSPKSKFQRSKIKDQRSKIKDQRSKIKNTIFPRESASIREASQK